MHNKLQAEKSRLAVAVQACEAATASISRPSSPRDTLPPPIPQKELEVRARLEDLIDQVSFSGLIEFVLFLCLYKNVDLVYGVTFRRCRNGHNAFQNSFLTFQAIK